MAWCWLKQNTGRAHGQLLHLPNWAVEHTDACSCMCLIVSHPMGADSVLVMLQMELIAGLTLKLH